MFTLTALLHPALRAGTRQLSDRLHHDQRGEGVISAAIAVLVMAFLGAAMWLAFDNVFTSTTERTSTQVEQIGS
jgi:hypothetical protein